MYGIKTSKKTGAFYRNRHYTYVKVGTNQPVSILTSGHVTIMVFVFAESAFWFSFQEQTSQTAARDQE